MADRFTQLDGIFRAALGVDPADRADFVARRCGDDQSLKSDVLALLAEDQTSHGHGPLDRPAVGRSLHLASLAAESEAAAASGGPLPESIGGYHIIRRIGAGGMGVVYEARQDNPRRTVALKVINSGVASPEMLRRFEHEAQVLGRLQHPGIAQIFEAGTFDSGGGPQPFFAMELVVGEPLTEYATTRSLPLDQRLELMAHVCDSVQHAHQRGVIHRDLKPGNILVVEEAGDASPHQGVRNGPPSTHRVGNASVVRTKVLDFGVARATDADVQRTMQTTAGQLVGTLPYMSPEQAAGDPNDLDTRSDVYALGVIAFELLAGQLPYSVRDRYVHEAVRVIREVDPVSLSSINRALRGDVQTIIGRALEKDKARRYQSASDFGDDIRRCLRDEPILARPPSRWYIMRKFAKRNRPLMFGFTAAALVLIAGVVGVLLALSQAVRQRDRAIAQATRADAINTFLTRDLLAQAAPELNPVGVEITVRELLDRAAERLERGYDGPVEVEAGVRGVVGDTYQALGLYAQAEAHWRRALDLLEKLHGLENPHALQALAGLTHALIRQDKAAEAQPLYLTLIETAPRVLGPEHPDTLGYMNNYAEFLGSQGQLVEASELHRRILASRERVLGMDHEGTLESLNNLAALEYQLNRLEEAERLFRRTVEGRTRVLGPEHPLTLLSLGNLGVTLRWQGKLDETEPIYRKVLEADRRIQGPEHPDTLTDMHNLATLLAAQKKHREAEGLYREAIDLRRKVLGVRHAAVAYSLAGLGQSLNDQGHAVEAEPYLREALAIRREVLPAGHHAASNVAAMLARCLTAQQRYNDAKELLTAALRDAEAGPSGEAAIKPLLPEFVALYEAWNRPEDAWKWQQRIDSQGQ